MQDAAGLLALDSDPAVMTYLGGVVMSTLAEAEEVVRHILRQYAERGVGRLAVVERRTGDFAGWSGLKYEMEGLAELGSYYDLGYRLLRRHWGKGYATESARASLDYGFRDLHVREVFGMAHVENMASNRVLEKVGMVCLGEVEHLGFQTALYRMGREQWAAQ